MNRQASLIRVCVLISSFDDSDSVMKEYEEGICQNPQHYFPTDTIGTDNDNHNTNISNNNNNNNNNNDPINCGDGVRYSFHVEKIRKSTAYRQIRNLVKSKQFDVFYNQCDGAIDEDRAGIEVVQALESFQVPFTGAISTYYEISKPDMKILAHYYKIKTPAYRVVERDEDVERICTGLNFPLIVKHISGYSSVGMDKSCKVFSMGELKKRVERFIEEYQVAMVEEFISGEEATILVCADHSQPNGVRVFPPAKVYFPPGEDFKYFDLKWKGFEDMHWQLVEDNHPALQAMIEVAQQAFKYMMGGIGYGRIDVRIDQKKNKNDVYFLEINPNCGIMYPYGNEGSADWILRLSPDFKQKEFAELQIRESILRNERLKPLYYRSFDQTKEYCIKAIKDIPKGTIIFHDECRPVRLCTKPYMEKTCNPEEFSDFIRNAWPVGTNGHFYALWDCEPRNWRPFNHSCQPNMGFAAEGSLNVIAIRDIKKDEELCMDYETFVDQLMPPFNCNCGSENCRAVIGLQKKP